MAKHFCFDTMYIVHTESYSFTHILIKVCPFRPIKVTIHDLNYEQLAVEWLHTYTHTQTANKHATENQRANVNER